MTVSCNDDIHYNQHWWIIICIQTLYKIISFTDVVVGFEPDNYTFFDGQGDVDIYVQIAELTGIIECDLDITVNLVDGPRASECYKHT